MKYNLTLNESEYQSVINVLPSVSGRATKTMTSREMELALLSLWPEDCDPLAHGLGSQDLLDEDCFLWTDEDKTSIVVCLDMDDSCQDVCWEDLEDNQRKHIYNYVMQYFGKDDCMVEEDGLSLRDAIYLRAERYADNHMPSMRNHMDSEDIAKWASVNFPAYRDSFSSVLYYRYGIKFWSDTKNRTAGIRVTDMRTRVTGESTIDNAIPFDSLVRDWLPDVLGMLEDAFDNMLDNE